LPPAAGSVRGSTEHQHSWPVVLATWDAAVDVTLGERVGDQAR